MKRFLVGICVGILAPALLLPVAQAAYPERQITMLVGLAAGGANDLIARSLADCLKGILPQPVSVVNKTGGSASIATADVVRSRPDGYNLLLVYSPALTILPHINPNLPYKGPGDIQVASARVGAPNLLCSRSNAPWKTMMEMIDYARKNPGKVRLGHTGIGSLGHLTAEDVIQATGVEITLVPFTGASAATTAVLGGHVDLVPANPTPVLGHLKAGTLRALTVFEEKRLPAFPNVPCTKELGLKVGNHYTNYCVGGPKGLPREIVQTLDTACNKAFKTEAFQRFAQENVLVMDLRSPEEVAQMMESEWAFYKDFLKRVKLQ